MAGALLDEEHAGWALNAVPVDSIQITIISGEVVFADCAFFLVSIADLAFGKHAVAAFADAGAISESPILDKLLRTIAKHALVVVVIVVA